jgi:hypothetical protein
MIAIHSIAHLQKTKTAIEAICFHQRIRSSGQTASLSNLRLKFENPFADISERYINGKSQSAGGMNCESAKQGTSEDQKTKMGFRK